MKYIDEYRNGGVIRKLAETIRKLVKRNYTFMEVCGGHTNAIHRFGIPSLLPEEIKLISGPGCPVCVTGKDFIDKALAFSGQKDVIITTFGDLIRVPGSDSSLEEARRNGEDIRVVISASEALEIAASNPGKRVIFLGIGFETTAPGTAVTIVNSVKDSISNFFVLNAHKTMPNAMEALIRGGSSIDGFICPGHVAAITGSEIFDFIPEKYNLGCVVTGFEPADILLALLMLIRQVNNDGQKVEIQYRRVVTEKGNALAKKYMAEVFENCDAWWRGLGIIPGSGLKIKEEFMTRDAERFFPQSDLKPDVEDSCCICGDILRGNNVPPDCSLFGNNCIPDHPVGACMVSMEGACNTWYRYRLNNE
jgi:hydrogenase expression/formation protein HypD